jgi:sec-independent protein translocase protein TatA
MPNIGFPELIVILLILVLVFGASRLPALGEGMGKAIRSFKRGVAQNEGIEVTKGEGAKPEPVKPPAPAVPKRVSPDSSASADAITDAEIVEDKKV